MPWWLPVGWAPEIPPETLKRWLEQGKPLQLVDARTSLEYRQGTIGRAAHAPVTEMPRSLSSLSLDKYRPVVMLCLSGHRSLLGTRWLRANGYEAYSLRGGLMAWKGAGYPVQSP